MNSVAGGHRLAAGEGAKTQRRRIRVAGNHLNGIRANT
jgi:hypothetical protein